MRLPRRAYTHNNDIYCLATKTCKEFYVNYVTVTITCIVTILILQTGKSKMIEMSTFPRLPAINNIAEISVFLLLLLFSFLYITPAALVNIMCTSGFIVLLRGSQCLKVIVKGPSS